jgi:hypothetical protein
MPRKYLTQTGNGPQVHTEAEVVYYLGALATHGKEELLDRYGIQDKAERQRLLALVQWAAARGRYSNPRMREAF